MTEGKTETPEQIQRLIDWNADVLLKLLKQVVAKREAKKIAGWDEDPEIELKATVAEEVVEVFELPPFDKSTANAPKSIDVPVQVKQQLKELVTAIAAAYRSNPYHCLQHASHVTMAVSKLISRIAVSDFDQHSLHTNDESEVPELLAAHLHNHSYGIVSDPLTQFTVVLSALIHAVDHRGISNEDLCKEEPELNKKFQGKSLTEQLCVEKAWKKLMAPDFENLRRCIYADLEEKKRFRQILVNCVMSTDIENEEEQMRRQIRWDKTFGPGAVIDDDINRKATSVIECLMQSSDIFHTLQHWHVYVKWNERGFDEANRAYKAGRIATAPAKTWYKDELAHFDNFVIPLAMQLKDIDAFVVCSDEYLNYALKNRQRWASNGRAIVAALVANYTTGSASAKSDLIKAISREGRNDEANIKDAAALKHLNRLVDWNNEVLSRLLKQILAKRAAVGKKNGTCPPLTPDGSKLVVDEVAETISFPAFDPNSSPDKWNLSGIQLDEVVATQLKEFVSHISSNFQNHAYHCLDHASQASMTAKKLIGRLTSLSPNASPEELHKQSFGLASDPLAQFAIVFGALIRDMEHPGVPNSQLVVENGEMAKKYKHRCIVAQQAINEIWNQLMQPEFEDLRAAICDDEAELKRFRQMIINSVLAADVSDPQLAGLRKTRWTKAVGDTSGNQDLKATITIVMLLQAADAFHSLQHWQLYYKWNERQFFEAYAAFEAGRSKKDPCTYWYKSELATLEDNVIPLCNQMKELGVFGNSADEFLAFATTNRDQWSSKGEEFVKAMADKYHGKADEKSKADRIAQRQSLNP